MAQDYSMLLTMEYSTAHKYEALVDDCMSLQGEDLTCRTAYSFHELCPQKWWQFSVIFHIKKTTPLHRPYSRYYCEQSVSLRNPCPG